MANLPSDELPGNFDVIVEGTGNLCRTTANSNNWFVMALTDLCVKFIII